MSLARFFASNKKCNARNKVLLNLLLGEDFNAIFYHGLGKGHTHGHIITGIYLLAHCFLDRWLATPDPKKRFKSG
jgi:hypothetical protein